MDGDNNGKAYFLMDDLGGKPPIFGNTHISHRIHVWYIYLHEWLIFMVNVGKYTSPMDGNGI